jgi:hypothetical protein
VVDSIYVGRYGKKKEAIIRHVLECGGASERDLHEKFGSASSRLRDFRRTWIKPILDDGVWVEDGATLLPAPDWREALERVRTRTDEDLDNRLQDQRYAKQRQAYRENRDNPTDPEPGLAGPERVADMVARAGERDRAARIEEQRRKVGMTAEVFLADAMQDASGFGWRELRALWMAKGGSPEGLRRAVKDPYRFNRDYEDGPLYVIRGDIPERDPAPVRVLREPKMPQKGDDSVYHHDTFCDCNWCDEPVKPKYAKAWRGHDG